MIYVAEYDHVKIKEQQGALQWKLWREHVQFAPPGLDAGQIGQVNDIDACSWLREEDEIHHGLRQVLNVGGVVHLLVCTRSRYKCDALLLI